MSEPTGLHRREVLTALLGAAMPDWVTATEYGRFVRRYLDHAQRPPKTGQPPASERAL